MKLHRLNEEIQYLDQIDRDRISDGSHTFEELYHHRMILFLLICKTYGGWKSLKHDDGTMYEDYFITGVTTPLGQFTYHYHMEHWDDFAVKELDFAPKWDGHTSDDVIRLLSMV